MAKKMFVVRVEMDMVVMAVDELAAKHEAEFNAEEEIGNGSAEFWVSHEAKVNTDVPPRWLNCIPWGGDDDRTVSDLISEEEA
jgi:hypothetical protein